jgi:hypothetical protein
MPSQFEREVASDEREVASDEREVASDEREVASDERQVASDERQVASEESDRGGGVARLRASYLKRIALYACRALRVAA